ncbi:MAG: O-antigen ligase family protein [Candidatus Paceibacterota bacterium]
MQTNTLDKFLRYFVVGGVFLIPVIIPFIVSSTLFFPFITGKGFTFRIITELIFGAWIIFSFRNADYRPKFSWIMAALAVFMAVIALADIFSLNPMKSFWSNFERMEGYITFLHLAAYFIVAGSMIKTEKLWHWFFNVSIATSAVVSFYGLFQLAGKITINQGGVRLDGTFGNAAYLASYMLFHIFLALYLAFMKNNGKAAKWLYGACIALNFFILYYTATRGALVGLVGGMVLAFVLVAVFERKNKMLRKIAIGVSVAIVAFSLILISAKNSSLVKSSPTLSRLASISLKDAGPRFMVWGMAWDGFKEHPILGWGQESFNFVFNKYYNPKMYLQEQWFDRAHDVVFDWLIAGGILGLLSYLFLFISTLSCIWKKQGGLGDKIKKMFLPMWLFIEKKLKLGEEKVDSLNLSVIDKSLMTGLLAGYFFQNLFVFDNIVTYILFFAVMAYFHSMRSRPFGNFSSSKNMSSGDSGSFNRLGAPLIIVGTCFVVYFFNVPPILAGTSLINALESQSAGLSQNLSYFKQAVSYNTFAHQEIREQILQAVPVVMNANNVDATIKQQFFDLGKKEMQKQIDQVPNDARTQVFMGSYLQQFRFYDDALPYLLKASELSPNKQSILFELGSVYLNKKDYDTALSIFKKAFDLEPNFPEARMVYATGAIYAGKLDIVKSLLVPVYGSIYVPDDRIAQAFASVGNFDAAIQIAKKKVESKPNDYQSHVSLAAAYLGAGDRTNSVLELQKAIALNPSFKDQGNYFITEIKAGRNP